jgi:hypothetical protein
MHVRRKEEKGRKERITSSFLCFVGTNTTLPAGYIFFSKNGTVVKQSLHLSADCSDDSISDADLECDAW